MTTAPARPGVTCLVHRAGDGLVRLAPADLAEIAQRARDPEQLLWLDIESPSAADIDLLRREFRVHPLAIEDLINRRQRPKVDSYVEPPHYFIVVYEVAGAGGPDGGDGHSVEGALHEIHLIVGAGYVVSVHWAPSPALAATQARFEQHSARIGSGVGTLLYTILDAVVDGYFPVIDALSEELDGLEESILARPSAEAVRRISALRRRVLELRRVAAPQRDVANVLLRRDLELIEDRAVPYLQDLYDHSVRVLEGVDVFRDLLAATLDAHESVTSNTLNVVVKRLTAFTVLLMVPTLIAGIYGMNFENMSTLAWPGGVLVLGAMAAGVAVIGFLFWVRGWF